MKPFVQAFARTSEVAKLCYDYGYIVILFCFGQLFHIMVEKIFQATGMGTQFGHFSVDRNGELCVCGNKGCLENRIGELALAKRAKECKVWDVFGNRDHILFKEIGELAAEGNEKAILLLDALVEDLGFGLGNLIAVFHPEKIIIGGMGRKLGELFLEKLKAKVKAVGFIQFVSDVEIEFTKLGEGAVLQGAAKYYVDTHYGFSEDMTNKLFLY